MLAYNYCAVTCLFAFQGATPVFDNNIWNTRMTIVSEYKIIITNTSRQPWYLRATCAFNCRSTSFENILFYACSDCVSLSFRNELQINHLGAEPVVMHWGTRYLPQEDHLATQRPPVITPGCGSMETPEPGPADGEELLVELRPRTRSNPEGAEDRRSSTGSLGGNGNPSMAQPAVGSRIEGEGEASTSDSPPSVVTTTATVSTAAAQAAIVTAASSVATAASTPKERPKLTSPQQQQQQQSSGTNPVPQPTEYQIRVPRVNCPEKVVGPCHRRWTGSFFFIGIL